MLNEISSLGDIKNLLLSGFDDWDLYGDVSVRHRGDLSIFNYTAAAQYNRRWNYFETISRGLILNNKTGEIVARPFDKFFNWGEGGRVASGHIVSVTEKMDGSLGVLYRDTEGYICIATRGSFDSDQALWATEYINKWHCCPLVDLPDDLTLLFEIVYPENRIVVDYGDLQGLFLLAARNRFTGEYLPFYPDVYNIANKYWFPIPKTYDFNSVTDIIEATGKIDANEEGWVVEFSDGSRFKFKGDCYIELHRLISTLSFKNTLVYVKTGRTRELFDGVPDEFLDEVKGWIDIINYTVSTVVSNVEQNYFKAPKDTRKDFAIWVKNNCPDISSYMFLKLDGKEYIPLIYDREF